MKEDQIKSPIAATFLYGTLFVLFFACKNEAKSQDQAIILDFWSTDSEIKQENQAMIASFQEGHPKINVNLHTYDSKDYWTKIRLQAQQKKLPDAFAMSSGYAEEWIQNGLLYNVSKYIKELEPSEYYWNFFDAAQKIANTADDYLIPYAEVLTILYYNKDMFDEAGLAYPGENWSWEEFLTAAKALTNDEHWGYWFYGRYAHIDPWVFRNGGKFINRDNYTYEPDLNAQEAIKFLIDLVLTEKVAPSKKIMSAFRQQDVFPQGKAAMWVDGSWNIENIRKIVGDQFRWGVANVPQGPNGSPNSVNGWADSFVIGKDSKNPDAAWEFLKYAISEGAVNSDALLAGKIPIYKPYAEKLQANSSGQPEEFNDIFQMASGTILSSFTKGWSEWRGYGPAESMGFNGAIDGIIDGNLEVEDALSQVAKNAQIVLDRQYNQ